MSASEESDVALTLVIPLRAKATMSRRADVPAAELRRFVTETLEPACAGSPEVLKLRRHLFEPLEATLDHPGVVLFKPPDLQYQAALEVVVADEGALTRFAASPAFTGTADSQREAAVSALFLPEPAGSPARIGGPTS